MENKTPRNRGAFFIDLQATAGLPDVAGYSLNTAFNSLA